MNDVEPKAFVLLSGGIDSAVCLKEALETYEDVAAIHYDYGQQTHTIEERNARKQAESHGIELFEIGYRGVFRHFAEGTIEDKEYSSNQTTDEGHSVGYVPQRNLHLLTSAAAVAEHNTETGRPIVLYHGAQLNDAADYPDCRPAFIESAEDAINNGTDQHDISIE
jgi:7-cyano-7-deazaguanine synthase